MDAVRALGKELSNWGRWGPDDQRGTLNFITPEKLVAANGLIRKGKVFSLALDLDSTGPQAGRAEGRFNPIHTMRLDGGDDLADAYTREGIRTADDYIFMPLQCSTQWDAFAHVWYDGQLYNGYPASGVTSAGAAKNGIGNLAASVAGRGVLLDIARLKGVACLPPSYSIPPEDLDAAIAAQGVEVGTGDILLIRTGAIGKWRAENDFDIIRADQPGLSFACARWLHDREVAAVAADNQTVEVLRMPKGQKFLSLHMVALRDMGLVFGEFFVLDELAADCAEDGVYEFFFAAPPLRIPKAVGSPVNPLAIK